MVKQYIKNEIAERGLDQYGQIQIDFSGLCTEKEVLKTSQELGFKAEPGNGQGVFWLY